MLLNRKYGLYGVVVGCRWRPYHEDKPNGAQQVWLGVVQPGLRSLIGQASGIFGGTGRARARKEGVQGQKKSPQSVSQRPEGKTISNIE